MSLKILCPCLDVIYDIDFENSYSAFDPTA